MSFHEMIGQMYVASFEEVVVSVSQDLFEINPDANSILVLHSVSVSQSSDAGDTESEMLNLLYHRLTVSGSGGTILLSEVPTQEGDEATDAFVVELNNTTKATQGTILRCDNFNTLLGYEWKPNPLERIVIHPDEVGLAITLQTTPSDALTLSGTIVIELIGLITHIG